MTLQDDTSIDQKTKEMMNSSLRLFVKFLVAAGVLGYVLYNSEHNRIANYLQQISVPYLLLAFLLLNLAQVFSALRMRYYFSSVGLHLNLAFSMVLYFVGMFFNLIVPGGIGGDAYKVFILKKLKDFPVGKAIKLLLANRVNGLYVLVMLMLITVWFIDLGEITAPAEYMALGLAVVGTLIYFRIIRLLFGETVPMAIGAMKYSLAVQVLTILAMVVIWRTLGEQDHLPEYILLFLAAAIVGVIPISVGGLGLRELTFFYGAELINQTAGVPVDPEFGVALSLCFFALNALSSILGLAWVDKITKLNPDRIITSKTITNS